MSKRRSERQGGAGKRLAAESAESATPTPSTKSRPLAAAPNAPLNPIGLRLRMHPQPPVFPFVNNEFDVNLFLIEGDSENKKSGVTVELELSIICAETKEPLGKTLANGPMVTPQRVTIDRVGQATVQLALKELSMDRENRRFAVQVRAVEPFPPGLPRIEPFVTTPFRVIRYRLKFLDQPPDIWYKDQGGRDKCIDMRVQLTGVGGMVVANHQVPLRMTLMYEDGSSVINQEKIMRFSPDTKMSIGANGHGLLRFRIEDVSKNHQSKSFVLRVEPDTQASPVHFDVSPDESTPVQVRSKVNRRPRSKGAKAAGNTKANGAGDRRGSVVSGGTVTPPIVAGSDVPKPPSILRSTPSDANNAASVHNDAIRAALWCDQVKDGLAMLQANSMQRHHIETHLFHMLSQYENTVRAFIRPLLGDLAEAQSVGAPGGSSGAGGGGAGRVNGGPGGVSNEASASAAAVAAALAAAAASGGRVNATTDSSGNRSLNTRNNNNNNNPPIGFEVGESFALLRPASSNAFAVGTSLGFNLPMMLNAGVSGAGGAATSHPMSTSGSASGLNANTAVAGTSASNGPAPTHNDQQRQHQEAATAAAVAAFNRTLLQRGQSTASVGFQDLMRLQSSPPVLNRDHSLFWGPQRSTGVSGSSFTVPHPTTTLRPGAEPESSRRDERDDDDDDDDDEDGQGDDREVHYVLKCSVGSEFKADPELKRTPKSGNAVELGYPAYDVEGALVGWYFETEGGPTPFAFMVAEDVLAEGKVSKQVVSQLEIQFRHESAKPEDKQVLLSIENIKPASTFTLADAAISETKRLFAKQEQSTA